MTYILIMKTPPHTVITTRRFLADAKSVGVTQTELEAAIDYIAANPLAGTPVVGTGGARKVRIKAEGRGKSGSYRTYHYYGGDDVPLFLLALLSKGQRGDIDKSEKAQLATLLPSLAEDYRKSVATVVAKLRRKP